MDITIGEIINDILPYACKIDANIQNGKPFVHAVINNETYMSRFHLYIIQINENEYSACDLDIMDTERYLSTGNPFNPLVSEKKFISDWDAKQNISVDPAVVNHLTHDKFIDYFIDRLSYYEVIKFDIANYNIHLSDLTVSGIKQKKIVMKIFQDKDCKTDTIRALINLVRKQKKEICLDELKSKDQKSILNKLRNMGLIIRHNGNKITWIDFEKGK